jgi:cleavage and polyadenylation specificity factor subunit 3
MQADSSKSNSDVLRETTIKSSSSTMADTPTLSVTMLGAGQEVGRSCCVLQYRGRTIVCDAGVHPAHSGMASLHFIDELDWSTVDAILITQ